MGSLHHLRPPTARASGPVAAGTVIHLHAERVAREDLVRQRAHQIAKVAMREAQLAAERKELARLEALDDGGAA